jgi:autotransporter-associated beta strand protein
VANQNLGGNTINLAGGNFNMSFARNAANPINNPFVITADAKFTQTVNAPALTGSTLSETFFGGISSPNNSKITFENMNPAVPTVVKTDCPADQPTCQIFYARFAGAFGFSYDGNVEIKNNASIASQLTRLSNFNTTGTTITWNGVISGTGQFSRSATSGGTGGNTVFTGANTYSGLTLVSDGTLYVNNTSGSGTGTGPVWVSFGDSTTFYNTGSRGILAGNGSTASPILIGRRGVVKPGTIASPIATFSTGALTFSDANTLYPAADGASYSFDLNSSLGTADLLNVNGNLSFSAGGALGGTAFAALAAGDLASTPVALANLTKFTLISYSGTWDGGIFAGLADDAGTITTGSGAGTNTFRINYNDTTPGINGGSLGQYVTLTRISAGSGSLAGGTVPEPTSAMLALVGLVPLLWRRSR